jgi:predicted lactoylglutathione lyase
MKINYFVFGTNDMAAAVAFYDLIFADCGMIKLHDEGSMTLWGGDEFMFALAEPFDAAANGSMVGFNLESSAHVKSLHHKALSVGATDEGEPGIRSGRFSAYVRDLDNNKVCFFV